MAAKNTRIGIRVSNDDLRILRRRAAQSGLSLSEYIRRCSTSDYGRIRISTDVELLKSLYADLRRAGNNLNQIARELNTHHKPNDIEDMLRNVLAHVAKTTDELGAFISDAQYYV